MLQKDLLNRIYYIHITGSFAQAAEKLYVSRQALIAQICTLEQQLGFSIFDRTNKGAILTPAGKIYLEGYDRLLKSYADIVNKCQEVANGIPSICIGSLPNLPGTSMPIICHEYHKLYPGTKISLLDYPLQSYFEMFDTHIFDIMTENMMNYNHSLGDLCFLPLRAGRQHIGVLGNTPLAKKKRIKFSDLRGKSLMLYKKGIGKSEDLLRSYIQKHEPDIKIVDINYYDSSLTTKCMLENAVVFLYSSRSYPNLKSIPADWDLTIDLGLGYRQNPSKEVSRLLELAEKLNKEMDLTG